MPLELRPETEAYRLCQPMHVLSFGEGLFVEFFTFTGGVAFRALDVGPGRKEILL